MVEDFQECQVIDQTDAGSKSIKESICEKRSSKPMVLEDESVPVDIHKYLSCEESVEILPR